MSMSLLQALQDPKSSPKVWGNSSQTATGSDQVSCSGHFRLQPGWVGCLVFGLHILQGPQAATSWPQTSEPAGSGEEGGGSDTADEVTMLSCTGD